MLWKQKVNTIPLDNLRELKKKNMDLTNFKAILKENTQINIRQNVIRKFWKPS